MDKQMRRTIAGQAAAKFQDGGDIFGRRRLPP
jgi:hypothetical protein